MAVVKFARVCACGQTSASTGLQPSSHSCSNPTVPLHLPWPYLPPSLPLQSLLPMDDALERRIAELRASGQVLGGELSSIEAWWRDHQEWLAERGYTLRPRYKPGWKPSWVGRLKKYQYPEDFEDRHKPTVRGPLVLL